MRKKRLFENSTLAEMFKQAGDCTGCLNRKRKEFLGIGCGKADRGVCSMKRVLNELEKLGKDCRYTVNEDGITVEYTVDE